MVIFLKEFMIIELKILNIPLLIGFKTILVLTKTRLLCTNCNKRFDMFYNDIVNPRFRCANELFLSIISDLQNSSSTFKSVAKRNFVSPGVVVRYAHFFSYMMQWEHISTLPQHIGIDEFKGNCDKSKYLFHIFDLDTSKTVCILSSRKYDDLVSFFDSIENRDKVKLVTMDLYSPFKNAVKAKLKNATIIADRFHYTRIVSNALDELRLQIWRNLSKDEKKFFKYIKLALLKDFTKVKPDDIIDLQLKLERAFEHNRDLQKGYNLYQHFLRIKDALGYCQKVNLFNNWIQAALSSGLTEFESAANTLLHWNKEILNSFKYTYTNSSTEGKNNKIKVIKRNAYGFKKTKNFYIRIMLSDLTA